VRWIHISCVSTLLAYLSFDSAFAVFIVQSETRMPVDPYISVATKSIARTYMKWKVYPMNDPDGCGASNHRKQQTKPKAMQKPGVKKNIHSNWLSFALRSSCARAQLALTNANTARQIWKRYPRLTVYCFVPRMRAVRMVSVQMRTMGIVVLTTMEMSLTAK